MENSKIINSDNCSAVYGRFKPMMLSESKPFDSKDFIFELKFDGMRVIAIIDERRTTLISRNGRDVTNLFPELQNLNSNLLQNTKYLKHKSDTISADCTGVVLDGEVISLINGKPDFFKLQSRIVAKNNLKIDRLSKTEPVQYVVFDILCLGGKDLTKVKLMERKKLLEKTVTENERVVISKYIEEHGKDLFELAKSENMEGIVAKRKDSIYQVGKRSKDWIKIKTYVDEHHKKLISKPKS